jgi:hypothetical protein
VIRSRPRYGERLGLAGDKPVVVDQQWQKFFDELAQLNPHELVEIEDAALTLSPGNHGQILRMTAAGAKTVLLPDDFKPDGTGFECEFVQDSATPITFDLEDAGESLRSLGGLVDSAGNGALVRLIWLEAGVWHLSGDLA